jgi:hypothetical protein
MQNRVNQAEILGYRMNQFHYYSFTRLIHDYVFEKLAYELFKILLFAVILIYSKFYVISNDIC